MRVMVTGGAGFIGSHFVDRLLAEGHEVDVVDDLSSGSLGNLADARAQGGLTFHRMDARDAGLVTLVEQRQPDLIWHLAGRVDRPGSFADPVGAAEVNVLGTLNVLEAARVHETPKVGLLVHGLYRREEPTSGRVLVGQRITSPSHVAAEAMVDYFRVYGDIYGVDTRVLACSNVFGPRQLADEHGPAVAAFVRAVGEGRAPSIDGDETVARDLLYVDDVVDALARAHELQAGSIVPIGAGTTFRLKDIATAIMASAGMDGTPEVGAARRGDRPGIAYPVEEAARTMGWRAFTDVPGAATSLAES